VSLIRTLIVDDEPLARANITTLLGTDPEISIVGECGSGTQAIEAVRDSKPGLLFLDVQMPGCDGFDVLERLGSDAPAAVVFVTAYDQYAIQAFEVEALDYLLKPFDDARFFRALTRAKAHLQQHAAERPGSAAAHPGMERLIVKSAGRVVFLETAEVDWIEAADYYACLHVGARTHLVRRSMSDLERDLDPKMFCRTHRSSIVNIARVRELRLDSNGEYEVALNDGTKLKVSRSYREQLQQRMLIGSERGIR
jgi:two-component system LytT family response regulator